MSSLRLVDVETEAAPGHSGTEGRGLYGTLAHPALTVLTPSAEPSPRDTGHHTAQQSVMPTRQDQGESLSGGVCPHLPRGEGGQGDWGREELVRPQDTRPVSLRKSTPQIQDVMHPEVEGSGVRCPHRCWFLSDTDHSQIWDLSLSFAREFQTCVSTFLLSLPQTSQVQHGPNPISPQSLPRFSDSGPET